MNKCYHEVTALSILKDEANVRGVILGHVKAPEGANTSTISFVGWQRINDNDIKANYTVFPYNIVGDKIVERFDGIIVSVVWSAEKYTFSIAS